MSGRGRPANKVARANGQGSVRELKRGELYQLRLPALNGGARPTRRFRGSEAQAREALAAWVRERAGTGYTDTMPTLAEWAQQYLDIYSKSEGSFLIGVICEICG